jgi:hypothetical protein
LFAHMPQQRLEQLIELLEETRHMPGHTSEQDNVQELPETRGLPTARAG